MAARTTTEISARSSQIGRMFDFAVVSTAVILGACIIAKLASEILVGPLETVSLAMGGK